LNLIMRDRKCFRCGKRLDFESYIKNAGLNEKEKFENLWNNDYIEFFCCHCYSFKIKYQSKINEVDFQYY
ncbi:MAG: hypothetical protein ACFFHD_11155, partial [Promethearchaeota archaeon]